MHCWKEVLKGGDICICMVGSFSCIVKKLILYRKDFHDPDNHDGVIAHLELEILECKVKWALGSIAMNKARGGGGFPAELFQILKMMLWKCCTQYASKFGQLSSGHRTGKGPFLFQSQKRHAKNSSNYHTIALSSQHLQSNAQKSPSQTSIAHEPRTCRCSSCI